MVLFAHPMRRRGILPRGNFFFFFLIFSFGVMGSWADDADCPNLFDTPDDGGNTAGQLTGQEKCFLDCTRDQAYDMACEDVDFVTLFTNAKRIPVGDRTLNVFLFNSPKITELDGGTFGPMRVHMKQLALMGLGSLTSFPMLKDLGSLEVLKIENTPVLRQFSPEILPANLTQLVLLGTAIQQLSADLQETKKLVKMREFFFLNHTIRSVREDFITIFPNLETAVFASNTFLLESVADRPFAGSKPYVKFVLKGNDFGGTPFPIRQTFLENLLQSLTIVDGGSLDLSNNGLPISKLAAGYLANNNGTAHLSLAGNQFGQFFKATGLLATFGNLKRLDLSMSDIPKQKGVLQGLDQLEQLIIRGNKFRNLNRVDIFVGCKAKLQRLDLSDNMLMSLPGGAFLGMTSSLTALILAGNNFHTDLLDDDDFDRMPSPIPAGYDFANLQLLDLSRTQLKIFKGVWVKNIQNLTDLDISCNKFKRVTKEFFTALPSSLRKLNMSFCATNMLMSPDIVEDAFSTLGADPPVNLTELILTSGFFKGWIFFRLINMPNQTLAGLQKLDVSNNEIRFLEVRHLQGFTDLKVLNLGGNLIQTIGRRTFSGMPSLRSLNLSSNHIVSVQHDELVDINTLEFLDLSNNDIVNLDRGSFDSLPSLRELYLNRNPNIKSMNGMFVTGGKSLIHLGIMRTGLTLVTYPAGCISRTDLDPLPKLKYFYIDNSTAVYVDHGDDQRSWKEKLQDEPMLPNDPYAFQCLFGNRLIRNNSAQEAVSMEKEPGGSEKWNDDFIRLIIRNPFDLSPRTFLANIPKCYSDDVKWVANSTSAFLCPNMDPKTFDASAPAPAS